MEKTPLVRTLPLKTLLVVALVGALLPATMAPPARAQHDKLPDCASERITGYIPVAQGTPDATTLHYQVLLPKGEGPFAAVMDYSGYQPGTHFWDGVSREFTCEGYAVVGLNIRGTGCSGGKFDYFEPRQAEDGREAIEWLTAQDWSNGRLAMVGKSYPGITQLFVAGQPLERGDPVETPDGLVAIVPGHVFGDLYRDVPYPGGIMNVTFAAGWSAGRIYEPFQAPMEHYRQSGDEECLANMAEHAQNPPFNPFVKALYNQYDGPLFKERSPWYWADNISVPTMLVESWQDEQVGSRATEMTERFADGLPWRMIATNGDHGEYYGSDVLPYIKEFLRLYLAEEIPERFAGGTVTEFDPNGSGGSAEPDQPGGGGPPEDKGPWEERAETYEEALARYEAEDKVQINFETGAGGDRVPGWISRYADWPAPQTIPWRLNMGADGTLSETEVTPGSVAYNYTPVLGTQQRGGYKLTGALPNETKASWSETPAEGTYAMFETAPFTSDKVLGGPASVDLTVSSTAVDTDFQVTVTEVRPDGGEVFVQQGWLRASHRALDESQSTAIRPYQTHELGDAAPLVPGVPTEVRIEVFPFAHAFRAGSSLRVYVEAPHTKPDLWGFALLPAPARNTIYTGPGLSSVALPLIEGEVAATPMPACGSLRNQPCRPAL